MFTNVANRIKSLPDGLTLQVTQSAKDAGLVIEDIEGTSDIKDSSGKFIGQDASGEITRRAGVYVYGFDNLLLVVDAERERVSMTDRAEIVATAARETGSIHRGGVSSITQSDDEYEMVLPGPGCTDAGLDTGDRMSIQSAYGVLILHDGTDPRIADVLTSRRQAQIDDEQAETNSSS